MALQVMTPGWDHRRELNQKSAAESTSQAAEQSWDPGLEGAVIPLCSPAPKNWDPGFGWGGSSSLPSCPKSTVLPAQPCQAQGRHWAQPGLHSEPGAAPSPLTPGHQMAPDKGANLGFVFKFTASQCKEQRRRLMHLS